MLEKPKQDPKKVIQDKKKKTCEFRINFIKFETSERFVAACFVLAWNKANNQVTVIFHYTFL